MELKNNTSLSEVIPSCFAASMAAGCLASLGSPQVISMAVSLLVYFWLVTQ